MVRVADTELFSLAHDFFKVYIPNNRTGSRHTVRAYQYALKSLFDFVKVEKHIEFAEITFEMLDHNMVTAYLERLAENGCKPSTQNHRLNCIRSFFNYAAKMNPMLVIHLDEIVKVKRKKVPEPNIVEHLNESTVQQVFELPDTTTEKGLRNQFLMILLYDTGARIQEVLDIRLKDIRLGIAPTVMLHGKGNKIRTVPLMEKTIEHLNNFLNVLHPGESIYSEQHLFYTVLHGRKRRMSENNARRIMSIYGAAAKELYPDITKRLHPHLWRHSRAMHLYQHGMDLTLLSQWLGHKHLDTTLIYAHADTEHKRKAIEASTDSNSPLKNILNSERFVVSDEDTLKKLYGFR